MNADVDLVQLMAGAARLARGRSREARRLRDRLDVVAGLRCELAARARAELERRREGRAIEAAPAPAPRP